MDIKTCYEKMDANYEEALARLQSEALIAKVSKKFINDQSYLHLKEALEKSDCEQAFFACHTLKGICLNLGFTQLTEGGVLELTELLRKKTLDGSQAIMEEIDPIYNKTIETLKEFDS